MRPLPISNPSILAIDQGTTSSRALVLDARDRIVASDQAEFAQIYPQNGWVEHDPEAIWQSVLRTSTKAVRDAEHIGALIAAIGITNQRETTLIWDRKTGTPIHNAIVWQDRRTADFCTRLRNDGLEPILQERTGLLLDPYFSASKIAYVLDHVSGARERARRGELCFGTVETFLIWRLTQGRVHVTDASNASRTALFNISTQDWDEDLLRAFDVPRVMLPEIRDNAADFGATSPEIFGRSIPIRGAAGDQQAALIGQKCLQAGAIKCTFGTGAFMVVHSGEAIVRSRNRLLSTIAYRLQGRSCYALEGSIFVAGAAIQWLRDGLEIIGQSADSQSLAQAADADEPIYMVPAFTGMGAPYWDANARGAIFGVTRATNRASLARAALESVCYQSHDLLAAMAQDGVHPKSLRADGGLSANGWAMQFLADMLQIPVERPAMLETTALGAAFLARLGAGLCANLEEAGANWRAESTFAPKMAANIREIRLKGWRNAVRRTLSDA